MVTKAAAERMAMFVLEERMRKAMLELDKVEAEVEPKEEAAKTDFKEKVKKVKASFNILNNEMARRENEAKLEKAKLNNSSSRTTHGQSNVEMNMKCKAVAEACNNLEKFGPGCEPAKFVRQVNNLKYLVECDVTEQLVLKMLFTRLSDEYQPTFVQYDQENKVNTIDKFTEYITMQYESRKSIFQFMEQLDTVELRHGESLRDFGTRLEQTVYELNTAVKAKFVQLKKRKDATFDGEMTRDDVFSLWGGMAMLKAIQSEKGLYTHTITKADDCFSALDLANVAEAYKERSQGDSSTIMHAQGQSYNQRNNNHGSQRNHGNNSNSSGSKDGVCWHWKKYGKCRNNPCPSGTHPDEFKKTGNGNGGSGNGGNNQRNNRQQNQSNNKPSTTTDKVPKKTEPEVNHIQGAQVYGAGFR